MPGRRVAIVACAVLTVATVAAGIVHFGRVMSRGLDTIAELVPAGGAPQAAARSIRIRGISETDLAGGEPDDDASSSPLDELELDLELAFGFPIALPDDVLEELALLEPIETPDEILVIEPGVPSDVHARPGPVSLSPRQRRIQAAQSGDEQAMREIIADLGSADPAASRDAWSAVRRIARTGDTGRLEALLAEVDPDLRERIADRLESLPYD